MNHNEEEPENLGGLGDLLPTEVLQKVNELLEKLNWTDHTNHGSKIEVVYVASGAQHVETQINMGAYGQPETLPSPPCVGREKEAGKLPEVIATDEAMALWKKAQAAGWVDANYQPLISRTQSALLADAIAEKLGIGQKWKTFETLWNRKNMRSDYNLALRQQQSLDFLTELKALFATGE